MEQLVNMKYKVTATVLTPLNIGSGAEKDWVEGVDYVVQDGTLYHIDLQKMVKAGIDMNRIAQLFVTGRGSKEILSIIGNKLKQVSDFSMPMPCSSPNPIKTFVRNQLTGRPVLVGSSLKGAIRSILFNYLRDTETEEKRVFGELKDGNDFMRFIRVSDFEFQRTELVNTKIFNLEGGRGHWQGGWKHKGGFEGLTTSEFKETGFNTIYECLPKRAIGEGYIMIAESLFEQFIRNEKTNQPKLDKKKDLLLGEYDSLDNLFIMINDYTRQYLSKELRFFKTYSTEHSEYIVACIRKLIRQIDILDSVEEDGKISCILKMSAGSGFHSITGDWQFDDYTNGTFDRKRNKEMLKQGEKVLPKSRKIAITYDGDDMFLDLMGFVKLTFETTG